MMGFVRRNKQISDASLRRENMAVRIKDIGDCSLGSEEFEVLSSRSRIRCCYIRASTPRRGGSGFNYQARCHGTVKYRALLLLADDDRVVGY